MRNLHLLLIALLVLGTLAPFLPISVHPATLYVPLKYPTIQAAINKSSPGDTILVSQGLYPERLVINKPLHLIGEARGSTIIDGRAQGTVVLVNASNVEVSGFTIQHADQYGRGIFLNQVNGVNITDNTVLATPDGDGVYVFRSNNTLISNNIFAGNLYAVNVTRSDSNRITGNQAVSNDIIGVQLANSTRTLVLRNSFVGGEDGVDLVGVQTSRNNVTDNLIKSMKFAGVFLLEFPQNNIISENTFQLDHIGVNLQNATQNNFYHNNFVASGFRHINSVVVGNAQRNTWDNRTLGGTVLGGNYWDNYTGLDNGANGRPANDGIGDTNLPSNGVDFFPLIFPFVPIPLALHGITATPLTGTAPVTVTLTANVLGSLKPFTYSWDFGDGSPRDPAPSPTHTYTRPGNYTVSVLVRDTSGLADLGSLRITVLAPSPPNYTIPILAGGIVAAAGAFGLFYWRRRLRKTSGTVRGER